jgi:hypothetical protein
LIQNFKQFKSIKDRLGLAGDLRKRQDFLTYSKDDIHWWSAWFILFTLGVIVILIRNDESQSLYDDSI